MYWVYSSREHIVAKASGINSTKYFLHNNHLGSVAFETDANGKITHSSEYQPYGASVADPKQSANKVSTYSFSGKELDGSGLYYFEARYYDPVTARFNSPDPLFAMEVEKCIESIVECNLYQYAGNNPVIFIDILGYEKTVFISGGFGLTSAFDSCEPLMNTEGITSSILSTFVGKAGEIEAGLVLVYADNQSDPKQFMEQILSGEDLSVVGIGFMAGLTLDGDVQGHGGGISKIGGQIAVCDGVPEDRSSYQSATGMIKGKTATFYYDADGTLKGVQLDTSIGYGAVSSETNDVSVVLPLSPNTRRGRGVLNSFLEFSNSMNELLGNKGVDIDRGEPSGGF